MAALRSISLLAIAGVLAGCPPKTEKPRPSAEPRCQKFGERCEYAPGKLGTCVQRTGCNAGDCLICQSQH